jgi:hypothetical protein
MRFLSAGALVGCLALGGQPSASAADAPASPPRFEVSGIMLNDDGTAWALVSEPQLTGGAVRRVEPGALIGPYRLVEVGRDHVVLQRDSEAPLRVRFGWRAGGGGDTGAPRGPQQAAGSPPSPRAAGAAPPQAAAPPQEAPPAGPGGRTDVEAAPERAASGSRGRGTDAPAPARASARRSRSAELDAERVDTMRRERERTFREELSVEGYFQDKGPKAAK